MKRPDLRQARTLGTTIGLCPGSPALSVLSSAVSEQEKNQIQPLLLKAHSGVKEIKVMAPNHSVTLPEARTWPPDACGHVQGATARVGSWFGSSAL